MNSASSSFIQEQFDTYYPEGINNHYWNHARNVIILNTIRKQGLESPIMEVGCGRGVIISYLKDFIPQLHGYEIADIPPYDDVKDYLTTGIDATTYDHHNEQYRSLMLLDVIEHIDDPVAFIKALMDNFRNVKRLLITVPACNELFSNYDEEAGHVLRYDTQTAARLAAALEMNIVYQSYFFHSLYIPARLLKFLGKKRNTVIKAPQSRLQKFIHRCLAAAFVLEHKIVPGSVKGSSLMLVLERT